LYQQKKNKMPQKLTDAKKQFVASWGAFGSQWGINKTMAQVHAHLLITAHPVTTEDIMEDLLISRGNANMNIRELINWGLVDRITIPGERKEYFTAEKDIWKVIRMIIKERKKKELEPMLALMEQLQDITGDKSSPEYKTYKKTCDDIIKFSKQADSTLDKLIKADEHWFWSSFTKLLK
jgi:DNA-binding transcriptional regulator GbsR (MarR family)